jgi:UDP-N-acetylmuramyl pentapeptide synthase
MKTFLRRIIASLFERQVRRLIARHHVRVIAVGGSVGKTSTKAAIAAVLGEKFRTLGQSGGYNSEIGLPLSVFELSVPATLWNPLAWAWRLMESERLMAHYPYEVIVLELGTDHPGEMARYLRYLTPDIAVITAITPEHMANFPGGLDEVAAEELRLAGKATRVLANLDEIPAKYRHHYIDAHPDHRYYGLGVGPDFGFVMEHTDPISGTTGNITHGGHVALKGIKLSLFGAHSAKAALAAYAVGDMLGLSKHQIEARLTQLTPTAGRMNPLPGANGSIIVDDSYNAQPDAVLAALAALAAAPGKGRRIAILGSMNELGPDAASYHQQVGAAAAGLDFLVTIGPDANHYLGPAAVTAGLDPTRFKPSDSPYTAGEFVKLLLQSGDVVLVKGSQNGVFSEEAAKLLLADPADAQKLVRQSPAWLRTKAKQFSRQR